MKKEILIDREKGLTRVAILEDEELCEFYLEREGAEKLAGNIYKGRVQNVLRGMQAAFVDIGTGKNAFLYLGDEGPDKRDLAFPGQEALVPAARQERVVANQDLLVQVVKEPDGTKGARLSTHITLPGRYVVLAPQMDYVGVSRRIAQEGERQRLKAEAERVKPAGMGLIVRTAAEGRSGEDFLEDVRELTALWEQIVGRVRAGRAPCCVHRDEDLITRTLRDLLTGDVDRIVLADAGEAERVRDALGVFAPALSERVDCYAGGLPLFDAYRIESRLEKALQKKVWLRNGGYLYIEATEALTVIDVNTGKFVGSRDLQDTVFRLNCEAAREIARQVRLRDIGGIIVIDFIDMQSEENRQKLVEVLREAFRRDRNKVNVAGLTSLGLVEMTRKRMRTPLSAGLQRACPCCGGTGRVLQPEHTARRALRDVRRLRASGTEGEIVLSANAEVLGAARALAPAGGVYLQPDARKGPNDFHVETKPKGSCRGLEYLE